MLNFQYYRLDMDAMNNFRRNLRSELDYQGLTVKELAAKTGIAKATLDCYLGSRANMPLADAAVKIAQALGSSVEYLVTGRGSGKNKTLKALRPEIRLIIQVYEQLDGADREKLLEIVKIFMKKTSPEKD
jgi:transcriptional regulator with XRE-family HTH domain